MRSQFDDCQDHLIPNQDYNVHGGSTPQLYHGQLDLGKTC